MLFQEIDFVLELVDCVIIISNVRDFRFFFYFFDLLAIKTLKSRFFLSSIYIFIVTNLVYMTEKATKMIQTTPSIDPLVPLVAMATRNFWNFLLSSTALKY